jgi:hypothetical protein
VEEGFRTLCIGSVKNLERMRRKIESGDKGKVVGYSAKTGENSRINNMHNTIRNQDIRSNDLRAINPDTALGIQSDSDAAAAKCLDSGAVLKTAGVGDSAVDDVVGEHGGDVLGCGVLERGSDGLEGFVGGGEDGEVGGLVDGGDQVGGVDGAVEGGQVGGEGGFGG